MRAPFVVGALVAMGCGERPVPPPNRVTETVTTTADAGAAPVKGDDGPPTAGTSEDVIARVFDLGTAPSIPKAFGSLHPGMARRDVVKSRPSGWGDTCTANGPESGVTLSISENDDPVGHMTVELTQRDAARRLATAWGEPALSSHHGTVCWLASGAHLKVCHEKSLEHDAIELASYVTLADALADATRSPSAVSALLGKDKAAVLRAYLRAAELEDPKDATKHRLEVAFPGTEYAADVSGDRINFFLDGDEKVIAIHLRYGANDPSLRPKVVDAVKAAGATVKGGKDLLVTVREEDQAAVVLVLDSSPGLQ